MIYRFNLRYIAIFFLLVFMFGAKAFTDEKPVLLFFHTEDCENCRNVKEEFLPGFLEKYGKHFTFKELDVTIEANLDSLFAMEARLDVPEEDKDYPVIYFAGTIIEGEIPIRMRLEYLLKDYIANPDSMKTVDREVRSRIPEIIKPQINETDKPVSMAYFYKHGCKECGRAEEIIDWLKETYPFLTVGIFDISSEREKLIATFLGVRAGVPENKLMSTPIFFIGVDYVLSEKISRAHLAGLVENYAKTGSPAFWNELDDRTLESAEEQINDLFRRFTVFAVAFAGLADGVNPCAFATILFFVSYLGMVGRKGTEILVVGLSFAFAVFLTYFLVGLGFFSIIKQMSHFEIVAKVIFGGTGALCIVFGFLSINDFFKARAGKTSDMALQLPAFLKRRIHSTIREKARMESFVAGAFIAGFLVSILEFACTGQVYLPTITLVVRQEGLNSLAVLYLLMYNVFFILPLLFVFGFVYFGMSSKGIAKIMESRVGTVKLILAVVFFFVGGLLIWTVF